MASQILSAIIVIVVGVGGCLAYFWGANKLVDLVYPSRGVSGTAAVDNLRRQGLVRPWLFIGPAILILGVYLIYPVVSTLLYSFYDKGGDNFVGLNNYRWLLGDEEFRNSLLNNLMWLIVVPAACTFLGLIIAVLTDKIWWGTIAKSLIFLPLAISFVGASVIWKFVYEYRGDGQEQIGILNAIVQAFGGQPQVWISLPFWNNFFLMIILIWIQTGFAMVILSSALRGIPEETIEAAVIDGANPFQIFWKIMIPQIWGTILVVWTTITILVLKVFDIVLTMTNGQWNSQVLANLMFNWMFRGGGDFGRGATIAIVIMIGVLPIMIWNIRQANKEGGR
ncbi:MULTISPECIES: carbohydrate ABC transporter permease [Mesorhizobium]|uniref:Sugar ABC transporter permease n=1 Tax=Mesorhizobium denitrificans TaxID=2294114 RepID=A0A371XJ93_9HYPH|nr:MULTISPECIES: sugar ABC transporter permease [Mesorhizobium]RFC69280.1 sugar ABC transporter permease [Mesorhizobium denitrificans]